jgi:ferrochelatase
MPHKRVVILLSTYGEPPTARFGDHWRCSFQILKRLTRQVAPIPGPLLPFIALRRGWTRARLWRAHNYLSPLELITQQQAEALSRSLGERDRNLTCEARAVFEFRSPSMEGTLADVLATRPERLVVMPLYAWDCDFTSGISEEAIRTYVDRHGDIEPEPEMVSEFSEDEAFVDLMARSVLEQADSRGWTEGDRSRSGLLLGAHGTVIRCPRCVDTGLEVAQGLYERLAAKLGPNFAHVSAGWLNHKRGGEWTSPDLASAAADMLRRGITRAVYFPFGFLADNSETQLEAGRILGQFPRLNVLRLSCLNVWPPFIQYLADRILAALGREIA